MTNSSKSTYNIMWQDMGTDSDALRILQLGWMLFLKIFSDKAGAGITPGRLYSIHFRK